MKSFIVLVAAALVFAIQGRTADPVDTYVRRQMEIHQVPGVVLAVVTGGVVRTSAYGLANVELGVAAHPGSVFEIGSLTKQFTAACILLLAQDGALAVDDPISRYLRDTPRAWSNVTIRHLLTHTSGIPNYTGHGGFEMTKRLTQTEFIRALAALPADFAPGEQAKYCNSGYNLLGYIIENASGQSYWNFLAERIWSPLAMLATTNRDPAILVRNRADGYMRVKGVLRNRDSDLTDVFSAGAIVSTAGDLLKWNAALDSGRILSAANRELMWTAGTLNDGTTCAYGFGWRIGKFQGRRNIGHSGSTSGFSASLQRFPDDKLTVIVLCNSDEPNIATTMAKGIAALQFPAGEERGTEER
jgi:D-alanyl-D-alanine carboxypeptidase